MIGKFLGKLVGAPIRIVAAPFRVLDHIVGVNDNVHEVTPGTILRDAARAVEKSVEEICE